MKGKTTATILILLLSLSLSAVSSTDDTFSVTYTFEPTVGGCGEVMVEDTFMQALPGEPILPYRAATILLPQEALVRDVKVKCGEPVVQTGVDLPWGHPPCTLGGTPVTVSRNEEIYNSMNWYPHEVFTVVSVESFRGFQILNVILYPVQYQPKSGTVKFYPTLTVEVQFGAGMKNKLYRGLPADEQAVISLVDNPEMAETYESGPVPLQTYEYIIITNDTMQSTFQTLADWKACFVNGTAVYTVSWITANYSGRDNPEKVRTFISDMYTNYGTKYVLLGGDIAAVPYRGFYISTGGYVDSDMLADMYFRCLDGTFNDDNDSYWGEITDGIDWYPEVAVGRAPCETVTEAGNFVNKVIAYEQAEKPKRALLHESRVVSGNVPDARCLAWNCDDYLPGDYSVDYVFEEDTGGVPKSRWISQWGQNPLVVAHIGHGNSTVYYINYEKDVGTVSWYNSDIASLTNTFWPWTTSVACITGQIEYNDCLAEAYVMDPDNGAIAAIYNDNYGWFMTTDACALSGEFCEMEFRACWSDGKEKFGDLLNQALSYMISSASSDSYYRWCFYERNLVGDPESPCLTKRECIPVDSVTITYPVDGQKVDQPITVTTSIEGCVDTVEFYVDGVLMSTDATAPFEYSFDPCPLKEDADMVISVKGYCAGEFTNEDSVTVYVDCVPPETYITITNPQDGATVSGTIYITADASVDIDTVEFYVDGKLKSTDDTRPFECRWNTKSVKDGTHVLKVEGYASGVPSATDEITVTVKNKSSIALLSFLLLFLPAIVIRRRH
ncbi:MAG: hypothetical protein HXS52_07820 [Theionarchaea archaeon]|nr:hypothetical protein [Theionarchaea archaeon]MBU7037825.1 hypothetical protein [Theionarchaea archaeon]